MLALGSLLPSTQLTQRVRKNKRENASILTALCVRAGSQGESAASDLESCELYNLLQYYSSLPAVHLVACFKAEGGTETGEKIWRAVTSPYKLKWTVTGSKENLELWLMNKW